VLAGSKLVAAPGFSGTMGSGNEDIPASWAPDGRSIVFVATTEWDQAARADVRQKLYRVNVSGGEPSLLTAAEGSYGAPKFTSDGQRLVVAFNPSNDRTYNHTRLISMAWPALGGRVDLTSALDRPAGAFGLSSDGRTVFFLSEDAGRDRLYSVPVTGGRPALLIAPTAGSYGNLSVSRGASPILVGTWEAATQPPEVVRLDLTTKKHVALTRFTAEQIAGLDLAPLREFTFTSSKGRPIHNFMVLPPNFDASKKYPLFVVIHGGPHGAWKDTWVLRWNYHMLASPGYVVLLTNYTGSPGFGEKFAQGVQGDPLKTIGDEVNEAADEAIRRFPYVDGTRQIAAGASYGGHLAFWLEATTTRYKALHSHAGAINPASQWGTSDAIYDREINFGGPVWERGPVWLEQNASLKASAFKTPILVTVGEQDFRVPLNNSLEAFALFQRMQVPSRLIVFPDENHWVLNGENSRFFYQELHAWFAKWLGTEGKTASAGGSN
jgi:dipeptidyl aminopeptidase/acylaminoacyl peptidase